MEQAKLGSTLICSFLSKRPLNSGVDARINLLGPDRMIRIAPSKHILKLIKIVFRRQAYPFQR